MHAHRALRIPLLQWLVVAVILIVVAELAIFTALAWQLLHVPPGQAPVQADPLEVVHVLHSNLNSNDVDAVLDLFTEDATVTDEGSVFEGKDAIRDWILRSNRIAGLHLRMLHSQVAGEKVFWSDAADSQSGVQTQSYVLHWTAVVQEGKIVSLTVSTMLMPDGK